MATLIFHLGPCAGRTIFDRLRSSNAKEMKINEGNDSHLGKELALEHSQDHNFPGGRDLMKQGNLISGAGVITSTQTT